LTLDTSPVPLLVPHNPVREITVADRDEIVIFDQALSQAPSVKKAAKTKAAPRPARLKHIPYAIGSDG
jgi:hypothetical protein